MSRPRDRSRSVRKRIPCAPSWLYSRIAQHLTNRFDRAFPSLRLRVRAVEDRADAIDLDPDAAPCPLLYCPAKRDDQTLDVCPAEGSAGRFVVNRGQGFAVR